MSQEVKQLQKLLYGKVAKQFAGRSVIPGITPPLQKTLQASGHMGQKVRSNLLRHKSYNPNLTKEDFIRMLPPNVKNLINGDQVSPKEQAYTSITNFDLVRKTENFKFKNEYFLVFDGYKSAIKYHRASTGCKISGVNMNLRFAQQMPEKENRAVIAAVESPQAYAEFLRTEGPKLQAEKEARILSLAEAKTRATGESSVDKTSVGKSAERPILRKAQVENFDVIKDSVEARKHCVVASGIPLNFTEEDIRSKFWQFDIKHAILVSKHSAHHVGTWLVVLHNTSDPDHLMNFHGLPFAKGSAPMCIEKL